MEAALPAAGLVGCSCSDSQRGWEGVEERTRDTDYR